jgi:hypothetical protein
MKDSSWKAIDFLPKWQAQVVCSIILGGQNHVSSLLGSIPKIFRVIWGFTYNLFAGARCTVPRGEISHTELLDDNFYG